MKLKYNTWKNVSISLYYKIVNIVEDSELTENEKSMKLVSLLAEEPEKEVQLLPAMELSTLVSQLDFLKTFTFNTKHCPKFLKIDGKKYRVVLDVTKLTTSQYLDFQNFYSQHDLKTTYGNLLACFLIPVKAKGYGDGYDPLELAKEIYERLGIQEANTLMFFFLRKLDLSIRITLAYLDFLIKRNLKKDPTNPNLLEAKRKMEEQINRLFGLRS